MSTSYDDDSAGPPPPPPSRAPPTPQGSISELQEHAPIEEEDDEYDYDEESAKGDFSSPPPPPPEPMADYGMGMDDGEEIEVPIESTESNMYSEKSDGGNRNVMYGGIACCVIIILAIVLGAGFGTGAFGKSGESGAPASAPVPAPAPAPGGTEPTTQPDSPEVDSSPTERVDAYNTYLSTVSNNPDALEDPTSAEWTTVRYMANNDPAMLDPTDTSMENQLRINQRYALLLLYFGSDRDSWVNQENWLNADECTWYGVTCGSPVEATDAAGAEGAQRHLQSETTVTAVNLQGNSLMGSLPPDLALLADLTTLNLSENELSGPIPASIYSLASLQLLVLDDNSFTGVISADVANLSSLIRYTAGDNSLNGPVPTEFASMPNLGTCIYLLKLFAALLMLTQLTRTVGIAEILWLYNNGLNGPLPSEFGSSSKLGKYKQCPLM